MTVESYTAEAVPLYGHFIIRDPAADADDEQDTAAHRASFGSVLAASRYKAYLQTTPDAGPVRVRVQLPPAGTPAPPGPWQGERTTEIDIPDGRVWVENVSAGGLTLHPGPTDRLTLPNGPGRYRLTVWFRGRTTPSPAGTHGAHPAPDTPDPGDGPSGPEEYVIRLTYLGPLADDEDDDSEDDDSEDDG
jgi:hypothetical protein